MEQVAWGHGFALKTSDGGRLGQGRRERRNNRTRIFLPIERSAGAEASKEGSLDRCLPELREKDLSIASQVTVGEPG